MQSFQEDNGPSSSRPLQVWIKAEITSNIMCIAPGDLKQQRGGKRVRAMYLLALGLYRSLAGRACIATIRYTEIYKRFNLRSA